MVDEQPERHAKITGKRLLQALTEVGLIHNGDHVRRVVIDIPVDFAVVVHVERYGDARLLRIARDLAEHGSVTIQELDDTHRQVQGEKDAAATKLVLSPHADSEAAELVKGLLRSGALRLRTTGPEREG